MICVCGSEVLRFLSERGGCPLGFHCVQYHHLIVLLKIQTLNQNTLLVFFATELLAESEQIRGAKTDAPIEGPWYTQMGLRQQQHLIFNASESKQVCPHNREVTTHRQAYHSNAREY